MATSRRAVRQVLNRELDAAAVAMTADESPMTLVITQKIITDLDDYLTCFAAIRWDAMHACRAEFGWSYREIGNHIGVSGERVRQILTGPRPAGKPRGAQRERVRALGAPTPS